MQKADKKAAQEKMIQQEHEQQEREDELRAMDRKIRMKEREVGNASIVARAARPPRATVESTVLPQALEVQVQKPPLQTLRRRLRWSCYAAWFL